MRCLVGVRLCLLAYSIAIAAVVLADESARNAWTVGRPVFGPGPRGSFDEVSVKDPSVVFFDGMWHVVYTARNNRTCTMGYVSANDLSGLQSAPRHELVAVRGGTRYDCAPQIFYFELQQRWYLVFQNRDAFYQPVFSTTATIGRPESWSRPAALVRKDEPAKWIDFWVICDETKACLFYTREHRDVFVRTTTLEAFPRGWGEGRKVFSGVHEAVHVYKVKGRNEYHMIYELKDEAGRRSFGLATARERTGRWKKVTDAHATGEQLQFSDGQAKWTEMVSHGEAIRAGFDQRMEYEPNTCRWLIQGLMTRELDKPYVLLPWRLGVMSKVSGGEWNGSADVDRTRHRARLEEHGVPSPKSAVTESRRRVEGSTTMTRFEIWSLVVQAVVGIGTLLVAIAAIWGEFFRSRWTGPRLRVSLLNPIGELTMVKSKQTRKQARYYHLKVSNDREWPAAENVRVVVTKIFALADGHWVDRSFSGPLQLRWQFAKSHPRFAYVGPDVICDLGRVVQGGRFELRPYDCPGNFTGYLSEGGQMLVELVAVADSGKSEATRIEITWDGQWSDKDAEMSRHLVVKEVKG